MACCFQADVGCVCVCVYGGGGGWILYSRLSYLLPLSGSMRTIWKIQTSSSFSFSLTNSSTLTGIRYQRADNSETTNQSNHSAERLSEVSFSVTVLTVSVI